MFKDYITTMGYIILTIVILAVVGGVLNVAGVFSERIVFKNSHQYQEGMAQRANVFEAQIAEIDLQIAQNPHMASQLRMQRKVLEIQLKGVK